MPDSSIITVGNELLSGFTQDTNSSWLAARLFARIRAVAETLGVGFVTPPKRDLAGAIPIAAEDVLPPSNDRLRPGGAAPPAWIREQIHSLFGRRNQ